MATQTGFVTNAIKQASYAFLDAIHTLATANGWVAVEDARTGANPSMILKGPGNLDYQDVYVGFRCYQSAVDDYYNMEIGAFNGYVAGATWANQPQPVDGSGNPVTVSVPLHNLRVDYWLCVSDLRIVFGVKVGSPIYAHAYAGLALSYQAPGQNTYPLVLGGSWKGAPAKRYSEPAAVGDIYGNPAYHMPYKGASDNCWMRSADNIWFQPEVHPWNNAYIAGSSVLRDTNGAYPLMPAVLNHPTYGLLGEFDGVFYIPGFGNATENTLTIATKNYVVLQAINQTGFSDFIALRLD